MITLARIITAAVLLGYNLTAGAATMNISAAFSPSMTNPANNKFTNTTPLSGHCASWPEYCYGDIFSINTNLTLKSNTSMIYVADEDPRDHIYFKLPPARKVEVTSQNSGSKHNITFTFQSISERMYNLSNPSAGWSGGSFGYPQGGCAWATVPVAGGNMYAFTWTIKNPASPAACYKKRIGPDTDISSVYMNNISVGYVLDTPSPLALESGIYMGSVTYSVGPGKDIDFGNKWDASSSELTINFTLSVNHELKITTTAEDQDVSLQPCNSGKICSVEQGKANWERWMVTRATPELTGKSGFSLSSSGAFTVYLQCEYQVNDGCAIKSDRSSQQVPVKTMLTLPDNVIDDMTGSTVTRKILHTGKDTSMNLFNTTSFGQNRSGHLDFLVKQRDVDTMLTTRPDSYRGAVTVIFDANIY